MRPGRARRGERLPVKPQPRDHARARLAGLACERELVSRARDEIRVVLAQLVIAIARSARARVASRIAEPGPAWLGAAARLRSRSSGATPNPAIECMINIHHARAPLLGLGRSGSGTVALSATSLSPGGP